MSNYRHGSAKKGGVTRTYKKWLSMRRRCYNPNEDSYQFYGAKGIKVDSRWDDFSKFLEDMGEAPAGMSLERIDSAKDYAPGNCKWATATEQARNRSCTVRLTYEGTTMTLIEWGSHVGMTYKTIWSRYQRGWSAERILTQPVRVASNVQFL